MRGQTPARSVTGSNVSTTAQALFDRGDVVAAADFANSHLSAGQSPVDVARLKLIKAVAVFETGLATESLAELREAVVLSEEHDDELQFAATLALFSRESQFVTPAESLPTLSRVRQLAASLGNPNALAGLHLAVARLEAYRGHCVDARRHLEITRAAASGTNRPMLAAAINLVDASLELIAGNLQRATRSAKAGFEQSSLHNFGILRAGSVTNLGHLALSRLELSRAEEYLQRALEETNHYSFVRLAALDSSLQLALHVDDLDRCDSLLNECSTLISQQKVPFRSWYDLAHQVTRCAVFAHLGDWESVVALTGDVDRVLEARQFRSVRTVLLCAAAKAFASLGEFGKAQSRLTAAIQTCPRGAVDPLIVLEAATGTCLQLSGEVSRGEAHFIRALSAARAIGNRLLEHQISTDRDRCRRYAKASTHSYSEERESAGSDTNQRNLMLSDVATILGASSSIDLVAHHAMSIIKGTPLAETVRVRTLSDQEFTPVVSVESEVAPGGALEIRLRGSDRLVVFSFDPADSIEFVTLVKSLLDILHAAVRQDARLAASDEQDLWPATSTFGDGETIFGSPRMTEILRVAIRLAATDLPILITGETGTGKDVFARLVHSHSLVKRGPFVPFNCSAIPKDLTESQLFGHRRGAFTGAIDAQPGVIRSAANGTLFLDEIGDLELGLQPKLLRFIESGEIHTIGEARPTNVSVRLIAATNVDLQARSEQGLFRKDLLFRLGSARIALPPLRERKDEIPTLTASFISRFSRESNRPRLRVSDDLIAALLLYDWPGNIRQLANELHRIVALAEPGQTLTSTELSPVITERWTVAPKSIESSGNTMAIALDQPLPQALEELERAFVARAMHASGGRVAEAAQLLGISRKGLFLKRRRWGHLDEELVDPVG